MRNIRAGFVGFGEVNTPREIIRRKCDEARRLLEDQGVELVWTDPVSDDAAGCDVARAGTELAAADFDLLILCVAGWIPSHAVIDIADRFKHKPMLLWGLTGWSDAGRFVTTADQAGTTALRKPMRDLGYTFKYVANRLGGPVPIERIMSYARAARAAALLRRSRIGQMGFRDMRLYGTLFDGVSLRGRIGPEVEFFEMLEMAQAIERLDPDEVARVTESVRRRWTFVKSPRPGTIENTVRLFLALRRKVAERGYEAVSLIDVDGVKKLMGFAPAGVFMLLHEEAGVSTIPENDTLGAVTQLVTRYLTGQVGAYLEFYEFTETGALMGVPDYVPSDVVDGPVTVMPTAFGEFGEGLLNVSRVKTGRVTLARLGSTGDRYTLHVTTGEAVAPRAWEEAGWAPPAPQLPSLEINFDGDIEPFIQNVLGQHYILSYGDHIEAMRDLCGILGVEVVGGS
jgi:L-fucose isomerase-like protein